MAERIIYVCDKCGHETDAGKGLIPLRFALDKEPVETYEVCSTECAVALIKRSIGRVYGPRP